MKPEAWTWEPGDRLEVATSGKVVNRDDRCTSCGQLLLYRMTGPESVDVVASFCGRSACAAFLIEIPEDKEPQ